MVDEMNGEREALIAYLKDCDDNASVPDVGGAWHAAFQAGRASLAANAPAATAADGKWYMLSRDGMATLCADKADAEQEAIDAQAAWPGMGPHRAVQLVEAGASLPLPGAQEAVAPLPAAVPVVAPHGWLYDWTHSSATGRPDETYTGFTKDEQHARKHDNCTPVYTAPQPALSAGWVSVDERLPEPNIEVLCAGRGWGNSFVTACYYDEERREWYPINTHWTDATGCAQYPTHWQPLPPSPSMDGESNG